MNLSDRWISKASSSSSFYAPSLLLLAVVVFLPSISFGFVYDDHIQITSNYILSSYWHIGDLLTSPTPPGDLYRPVTMFSFLVSRLLHGLSPAGFHGVNILLHAINSVLVFAVLRSLFSERLAFLSACLFAINPVHTEAVVNIVGRAELLAALFGLSAVYLTTTKDQFSYSKKVLFALLLLLSTLSKESGILYGPLAFTVLWFVPRYQREEGSRMKWVLFSSFVCAALFVLLRYMAVGEVFPSRVVDFIDNPLVHFDLSHRLLAAVSLLSDYFVLTFIPFPLSADYSFATLAPEHFAFSTETFLKVIFAGLLVLCLVFARKRSPEYA
ncbi:MAG: hypothetical protein KDD64_05945, partial [Bdellovibrionales bacterium]|nr:hypothetical protein [Bdellovibrionales bacterium]